MTDDTGQDSAEPFVIMPTAHWALGLEQRVHALEDRLQDAEGQPQAAAAGEDRWADVEARLARHRLELEQVKAHQNDLLEFLRRNFPAQAAPADPAGSPL